MSIVFSAHKPQPAHSTRFAYTERASKLFAKAVNKKFIVYSAVPLARNSAELYLPSPLLSAPECNSVLIHLTECISFTVISVSDKMQMTATTKSRLFNNKK